LGITGHRYRGGVGRERLPLAVFALGFRELRERRSVFEGGLHGLGVVFAGISPQDFAVLLEHTPLQAPVDRVEAYILLVDPRVTPKVFFELVEYLLETVLLHLHQGIFEPGVDD